MIQKISQKTAEIIATTCTLMDGRICDDHNHQLVVGLERIWRAAIDIQHSVTVPNIIAKYHLDALGQMERACELIEACDEQPSHSNLLAAGLACELAVSKVHDYQQLAATATSTRNLQEVLNGLEHPVD